DDQAAGRFRMTMSARVQRQVREDAAKQVLEKLRNRIDKFNVAEPTIARQGEDRILIQLPGIQDIQRAKDLIGKTGYLEFRLVERFVEGGDAEALARPLGADAERLPLRAAHPTSHP